MNRSQSLFTLHGNQLGHGSGVQLAVEMGAASVDHCTYLSDDDIAALAASETVATFLPATDFSTRQPYPDARRAIDAGVAVAIATNTNPGSSNTTSMSFCIALAVRDMKMTAEEAVLAATLGGARALGREDIGHLAPGASGDAVILDALNYSDLIYRPGVPLIAEVITTGRQNRSPNASLLVSGRDPCWAIAQTGSSCGLGSQTVRFFVSRPSARSSTWRFRLFGFQRLGTGKPTPCGTRAIPWNSPANSDSCALGRRRRIPERVTVEM